MRSTSRLTIAALALALPLSLAACGSSDAETGAASSAPMSSSAAPSPSESMTADTASMPFGPGCAAVPADGAGSFQGMSTAPVATAASNNPVLSTLVQAVTAANLGDTLNSAQNITVFAPDNAAFAKIPPATLKSLLANKAELTKILTYHVASARYTPSELGSGMAIKTLEGGSVAPAVKSGTYTVNSSNVVCGNVQTANATVYIIDTVMMPPASS